MTKPVCRQEAVSPGRAGITPGQSRRREGLRDTWADLPPRTARDAPTAARPEPLSPRAAAARTPAELAAPPSFADAVRTELVALGDAECLRLVAYARDVTHAVTALQAEHVDADAAAPLADIARNLRSLDALGARLAGAATGSPARTVARAAIVQATGRIVAAQALLPPALAPGPFDVIRAALCRDYQAHELVVAATCVPPGSDAAGEAAALVAAARALHASLAGGDDVARHAAEVACTTAAAAFAATARVRQALADRHEEWLARHASPGADAPGPSGRRQARQARARLEGVRGQLTAFQDLAEQVALPHEQAQYADARALTCNALGRVEDVIARATDAQEHAHQQRRAHLASSRLVARMPGLAMGSELLRVVRHSEGTVAGRRAHGELVGAHMLTAVEGALNLMVLSWHLTAPDRPLAPVAATALVAEARAAAARLREQRQAAAPEPSQAQQTEAVLAQLDELVHFLDPILLEAGADDQWAHYVEVMIARLPLLIALDRTMAALRPRVAALCASLRARTARAAALRERVAARRSMAAGQEMSQAAARTSSSDSSDAPDASEPALPTLEDFCPARLLDAARAQPEQEPVRDAQRMTGTAGVALRVFIEKHVDRGTFASAWDAAVYHFRKHAAHLPHATLEAYVRRALAARPEFTGQRRQRLSDPSQLLHVVRTARTYLLFSPEGKIVSYHDHRERPYA